MRATIHGLVSGRLKVRFERLGRRRRRALCVLAYGSGAAAIALAMIERPWSVLPALALFAVCGASYYPLHVFSQGIDYRARPRTPFGGPGGPLSVEDGVDEAELQLLYNVYLANRWFLSSAVMALVTYPMLASWFGWWLPEGVTEWGLIVAGAAGFVSSLPTVIWGWLEPGTHECPYPADEDLD
jgi:MFS family permease